MIYYNLLDENYIYILLTKIMMFLQIFNIFYLNIKFHINIKLTITILKRLIFFNENCI